MRRPSDGSVIGRPRPRKLNVASREMAWAVCSVPTTMSGAIQFGDVIEDNPPVPKSQTSCGFDIFFVLFNQCTGSCRTGIIGPLHKDQRNDGFFESCQK